MRIFGICDLRTRKGWGAIAKGESHLGNTSQGILLILSCLQLGVSAVKQFAVIYPSGQ